MKTRIGVWLAGVLALGLAGSAQAALHDRGGGLIYDDVLNITWLSDANYAQTSGFDADGRMTWDNAVAWAAGLSYFDAVRNVTYSDWRLPTVGPINGTTVNTAFSNNATTDSGYAKTTTDGTDGGWRDGTGAPVSEMGHMYYVNLANLGFCTPDDGNPGGCVEQTGWGLANTGLFSNLQSERYWSGTEFAPFPTTAAWGFLFDHGLQGAYSKISQLFAWAVRPGDVAAVPEPASLALVGTTLGGLLGVGWGRRRR